MAWFDDDYSLAGLTQEGHESIIQTISSDEDEPVDAESNFRLLLEGARLLSTNASQISNFDDKIFQLSHGESVASVSQGLSQLKRPERSSNSMASSMVDEDSDIEVVEEMQESGLQSRKRRYEPEVSDISDSDLVDAAISGEKVMKVEEAKPATVFKAVTARNGCCQKIAFNQPGKLEINPARSSKEMDNLARKSVQDASLAKMKWALGAYERWRKFRAEIFSARYTATWTRNNRPIELIHEVAGTVEDLKRDVCDFIVEIRKENGDQYPSSSLYDLLQRLSMYLEREKGFENKLMSGAFRDIRNTLDNMMKERAKEDIQTRPERQPIMEHEKETLWQKGVLGEDSPDKLRYTIFFLIGVRFGLRGLSEQYNLQRYPDCQISIVKIDDKDALVYREFQSKTRQGGISDRGKNPPRVSYAFCNGCRSRCFVELFRKYLFLAPQGRFSWPKFYVQTDPQWQPGSLYWYTNRPVGKNTLSKYIKTIMEAGGIEGYYRNHSTRKSTCTCLFQKGVDPQLIKEQTGHKSDAIMRYKKSNIKQKKEVSDMLSVLPQEMQTIRDREKELLSEDSIKKNTKI